MDPKVVLWPSCRLTIPQTATIPCSSPGVGQLAPQSMVSPPASASSCQAFLPLVVEQPCNWRPSCPNYQSGKAKPSDSQVEWQVTDVPQPVSLHHGRQHLCLVLTVGGRFAHFPQLHPGRSDTRSPGRPCRGPGKQCASGGVRPSRPRYAAGCLYSSSDCGTIRLPLRFRIRLRASVRVFWERSLRIVHLQETLARRNGRLGDGFSPETA